MREGDFKPNTDGSQWSYRVDYDEKEVHIFEKVRPTGSTAFSPPASYSFKYALEMCAKYRHQPDWNGWKEIHDIMCAPRTLIVDTN